MTVLFCDLVDSTTLAAKLGAENWSDAVRRFQETAVAVIERFEGYVAQYLGDGLLVYFGYPHAHEDAAARAVRCGLALAESLPALNEQLDAAYGISFAARTSVHTGMVVVGEIGAGERRETLALGDIPNIAAHLQRLADPNAVVLSSSTLRLVPGLFVTRDLGTHGFKGTEAPLGVHQAVAASGMRSRLDHTPADALPPLAGRGPELELLLDRWAKVCEGHGQAVAITGDPGMGKSRLVLELSAQLAESAHTWLECGATAYTRNSAFFPVLDLHHSLLGFGADASREEKLARLEAGLEAADFDPADTLPIMAALHGLEPPQNYAPSQLGPTGLRKTTLEVLASWLLRLGVAQPVVLLIEDLHWLDPSTLDLLTQLIEGMSQSRVLLLVTQRNEVEPGWGDHSHFTSLPLSPLPPGARTDLIRTFAGARSLPDEWIGEISRRSDGVPLFAEELTRAVLEAEPNSEQGAGSPFPVPHSLEDLLMTRLDQLGPAKEIAQLGAVMGREFHYPIVRALWPRGERDLQSALSEGVLAECFFQRGTPPNSRYAFKHALIRDTAYQSLLRKTRRRYHAQVARVLVSDAPEVALDQPELVAHHWTEAGEAEQAIASWQRAGELAVSRAAHQEAIRHLSQALGLIAKLPDGPFRDARELSAQLTLAHAYVNTKGWGHDETRGVWERAQLLCDPALDPLRSGAVACGLADSLATSGDLVAAHQHFEQAGALGTESGLELLVVAHHQGLAFLQHYQGQFGEALEQMESALAIFDAKRHNFLDNGFYEEKGINLLAWSGWIFWHVGQPDRAWAMATRAVDVARERTDPFGLDFALTWASITALLRRDWPAAQSLGREAAKVGSVQGFPMLEALGAMAQAVSEGVQTGEPAAADRFAAWLPQAAESGNRLGVPMILSFLAELQLHVGLPEQALATVDGALAGGQDSGQPCYDARLLELKAEALRRSPGFDAAEVEGLFRSAVDTAHGQNARGFELRAATSLARFLREGGRDEEARQILRPVYDAVTEGHDTADVTDAKAELDALA